MDEWPAMISPFPDGTAALLWACGTAILVIAGWRWAGALFPNDPLTGKLVHACVLCWAPVVATSVLLSLAGWLNGPLLTVGVAVLVFFALVLVRQVSAPVPAAAQLPPGGGRFPHQNREPFAWRLAWIVLAGFLLANAVTSGLLSFPSDWDSLNYHIPLVVHWLQAGSLYAPDGLRWSEPANNEILGLWLVGWFSGDFLIGLNNVPAVILLASSTVELARTLGLSRGLEHLAALLVVGQFLVFHQLGDAENDVAVAALFFASLWYLFRYWERPGWANLSLGAISVGLLAGVKFYALGYAFILVVGWLELTRLCFSRPRALVAFGVVSLGLLLWGGYWYFRNLAVTGSPLYPVGFFAEPGAAPDPYPDLPQSSLLGNGRPEIPGLLVQAIGKMAGPGHLAAFFLVPISAPWLFASGVRRYRQKLDDLGGSKRLTLALVLCAAGAVLAVTPFAAENDPGTLNLLKNAYCPVRYGLCFLNTAVLAAVVMLRDFLAPLRKFRSALVRHMPLVLHLLLVAGIGFQLVSAIELAHMQWLKDLVIAASLVLAGGMIKLARQLRPHLRSFFMMVFIIAGLAGWTWWCAFLSGRWHWGFNPYYQHFREIPDLSNPALAAHLHGKICVLDYCAYPFFGSARKHRLCQPMYIFSPEWLMNYFEKNQVSLIVGARWTSDFAAGSFLRLEQCRSRWPGSFHQLAEVSGRFWIFAFRPRK